MLPNTFATGSDSGRKEILAGAGRQRSDLLLTAPAKISCGRNPLRGSVFWRFPAQSNARGRARVSPGRGRCEAAPACPRPPRVATPQRGRGLIRLLGRAWQASATGAVPPSQKHEISSFLRCARFNGKTLQTILSATPCHARISLLLTDNSFRKPLEIQNWVYTGRTHGQDGRVSANDVGPWWEFGGAVSNGNRFADYPSVIA